MAYISSKIEQVNQNLIDTNMESRWIIVFQLLKQQIVPLLATTKKCHYPPNGFKKITQPSWDVGPLNMAVNFQFSHRLTLSWVRYERFHDFSKCNRRRVSIFLITTR